MDMNQQATPDPKTVLPLDTNAEYISVKGIHDQPPIITSVFRSIFVEIPKEFYFGIRNFFKRFSDLFKDGFKYLKYPSLKVDPFATKDYKENCQHTFEFVLIVVALLIFLIKLDWIYQTDPDIKNAYNNDISQALIQFMIFVIFAITYFLLVVLSVLLGRLWRKVFKMPVTRQESDILFTYLNNILFILTASIAFFIRCIVPVENIQDDAGEVIPAIEYGIFIFFVVVFGIMIFRWAGRLALLNHLNHSARMPFQILVTSVSALLFGFCSFAITFFIWGV